jgi:hypothetical protein
MIGLTSFAPHEAELRAALGRVTRILADRGVSLRRVSGTLLCLAFAAGLAEGVMEARDHENASRRLYQEALGLNAGVRLVEHMAWLDAARTGRYASYRDAKGRWTLGRGEALAPVPVPSWDPPSGGPWHDGAFLRLTGKGEREPGVPVADISVDGGVCRRFAYIFRETAYAARIEFATKVEGEPLWAPLPRDGATREQVCGPYGGKRDLMIRLRPASALAP